MRKPLLLLIIFFIFFAPVKGVIGRVTPMTHHGQSIVKRAAVKYINKLKPASAAPDIIVSAASGAISACVGSPSTNTQQFTVSGSDLSDNIMVMAPAGFEISLNAGGGFSNALIIAPIGGSITNKIVYVRAAASGTAAYVSNHVTLTTTGATTQQVAVQGLIFALPTVDAIPDLTFTNGDLTTQINFTGIGNTFYWTNDQPGIGLAVNGGDNITPFTAVNTGSSPVVAHISVTSKNANVAYIPDYDLNTVSAVNTITNKIIGTIPVGANPGFVAISPDGKKAYVANVSGSSLSVINTQTNQVKDISISDSPTGLIFSKDGTRAYIAGASGVCTVIDVANDAVLTTLTLPPGGAGLAISDDGKWLYATNFSTGDVRVYDINSNAEIIYIPTVGARYAATSPDGTKIYVTGSYSNSVYVIDAASNTLSATINLTADAEGIGVSPDGSRIYVTNQSAGTVTVINATNNSVMITLAVGKSPQGISVTPDGKYVYVANAESGTLSVISTSDYTVAATIPCGTSPHAVGNFITPGINTCTGNPTDFKITVNPSPTTITPGTVGGLITTCIGAPSTNTQQFTVSGNNLSGNITATSPAGLEISFNQTSGFADVLTITPTGGAVTNKVIYVRAKASGTPAIISDYVVLSTAGAVSKNVAVKGVVSALPTTDATNNPVYNNGDITAAISFNGTGNTYTWANDTPSIGLGASGINDIPSFTTVNTGVAPVKATITVTPSSAGYLYLTGKNSVVLVNADNNTQTGSINTGGQPTGVAVSPDGTLVAITDNTFNTVKFISTITHKVVSTVNNIPSPIGICFSADGKKVYTANDNPFAYNVSIIDVATATVEASVYVGTYPYGIAASPDGTTVYVGCIGENAIIAIDTKTHQTTPIKVNFGPTGIAVSPDNSRVYATSAQYNGLLKVVNTATKSVIANIPIGDVSTGICVSPDGKRVYVSNTRSNNVMVIDAETYKVIATIPVGIRPFGVSITPDGKYVYVANEGSNNVDVINTADNSISNIINVTGQLSICLGNFFAPGTGCTGMPTKFTITVNGLPIITASVATGTISACIGSPSTSTQQFTVSGSNLSSDITVTAPANFEVSLSPGVGYANTLTLVETGGKVSSTVIYVRSSASAPAGNISGTVTVSSTGAPGQTVAVSGIINALPVVNQISPLTFNNGAATTAINFTGTATTYTWANDTPGIGLQANGSGSIPPFTAVNSLTTPIIATITVVPSDASCTGSPVIFKVTVNPTPAPVITFVSALSPLSTVYGKPSASGSFNVSGDNLVSGVGITPPAGFEVSTDGINFKNTVTIGGPGTLAATTVYIRLAKTAFVGNYAGNITLTSDGSTNNLVMPNSTVIPASMIITADNKTRPFHSENPQLTITYNGFVNNENESNLVKKPEVGTMATFTSAVGEYAISFTSEAESPNYSFTYVLGVLTVTATAEVVVVNTFTPNGDGTNDTWAIKHIEHYPNCSVNVFDRWGGKIFSSVGYGEQWDGQSGRGPVPAGTYYYIINLKDGSPVKAGWVAVVR